MLQDKDVPRLENLQRIRLEKNWTQSDLSKATSITQETISAYETGKQKPGMDNLLKIAMALGCTLNDLFGIDRGVM